MSNKVSRPEGGSFKVVIQRFLSSYGWIMTLLQNSVSKKSRHFVFAIFSNVIQLLISSGAAQVSFSKFHDNYPCKKLPRNSSFKPKTRGKQKDSVVLIVKKCQFQNITKMGFEEPKIKSMSL